MAALWMGRQPFTSATWMSALAETAAAAAAVHCQVHSWLPCKWAVHISHLDVSPVVTIQDKLILYT
jgi:hypothetical protein